MRILLTGFEKFLDYSINPSEKIAESFNSKKIGEHEIVGKIIKLEYGTIRNQIRKHIDEVQPEGVLLLGQAGRTMISLEKIAVNYADSNGSPYNCGTVVKDQILIKGAKDGYFSRLNIPYLLEKMHEQGIPSSLSLTAGSYGCNQLFYETMYYLDSKQMDIPAGFVHIPMISEQSLDGKYPTLEYSLIEKGIMTILENIRK